MTGSARTRRRRTPTCSGSPACAATTSTTRRSIRSPTAIAASTASATSSSSAPTRSRSAASQPGDRVDVVAVNDDGIERRVRGFQLVAYAFPEGSCAAYYPETNPLVALAAHDPVSFTPSYKGIPVRLVRAGANIDLPTEEVLPCPDRRHPAILSFPLPRSPSWSWAEQRLSSTPQAGCRPSVSRPRGSSRPWRRPAARARPPAQPCQGRLLHRRIPVERQRRVAVDGAGLQARHLSGAGPLQPRHAQPERGGCNRPGARHGPADRDARRRCLAQRHDRRTGLRRVDPGRLLRTAPDGTQGSGRDEGIHRPPSRVPGLRRMGRSGALDLELCRGSVQRPQRLPVHRRLGHRPRGALVAEAGRDAGADQARRTRQEGAELSRTGDHAAGRRRAAALDDGRDRGGARRQHRRSHQGLAGRAGARSRSAPWW